MVKVPAHRSLSTRGRHGLRALSKSSDDLQSHSDGAAQIALTLAEASGETPAALDHTGETALDYEEQGNLGSVQLDGSNPPVRPIAVNSIVGHSSASELATRVLLLEKRLQLLSDEFSTAVAKVLPANGTDSFNSLGADERSGEISFDADSLSQFVVGFYQREYDDSGVPIRWTGGGPFCELRVHLDRSSDRRFSIDVGDTGIDVLKELVGFVDYATIPLEVQVHNLRSFVVGVVPKRAFNRLAVITLALGRAPDVKDDGSDDAWLGFRFYSMKIKARDATH